MNYPRIIGYLALFIFIIQILPFSAGITTAFVGLACGILITVAFTMTSKKSISSEAEPVATKTILKRTRTSVAAAQPVVEPLPEPTFDPYFGQETAPMDSVETAYPESTVDEIVDESVTVSETETTYEK